MSAIPQQLRRLPSFADLLLFPRFVDKHAKVRIEENIIHIDTQKIVEMTDLYRKYSSVQVRPTPEGIMLLPVQMECTYFLVNTVAGYATGIVVYDGNWFSSFDTESALRLMHAGVPFHIITVDVTDAQAFFEQVSKTILDTLKAHQNNSN